MNRLSKEKRDRLILVAVVTVVVLAGLWYFGVHAEGLTLLDARKKTDDLRQKITTARELAKKGAAIEADTRQTQDKLTAIESTMLPVGNEYMTLFNTIKQVVNTSKIEFDGNLNAPEIGPLQLLPEFPYRAATFSDTLFSGYYHDFGKFLAYLENNYPYLQFQVTSIRVPDVVRPEDPERLRFAVRIVALVQPTTPH